MCLGQCESAADHRGGTISIIYSTTVDIASDVMSTYTPSMDITSGIQLRYQAVASAVKLGF